MNFPKLIHSDSNFFHSALVNASFLFPELYLL
nr:MAG TPA: hypothetical protein [Caudoviricetes sp.]DAT12368.1 MAG TPA: hypothetical protein [Caudoviricetes sp.]